MCTWAISTCRRTWHPRLTEIVSNVLPILHESSWNLSHMVMKDLHHHPSKFLSESELYNQTSPQKQTIDLFWPPYNHSALHTCCQTSKIWLTCPVHCRDQCWSVNFDAADLFDHCARTHFVSLEIYLLMSIWSCHRVYCCTAAVFAYPIIYRMQIYVYIHRGQQIPKAKASVSNIKVFTGIPIVTWNWPFSILCPGL